MHVLVITCVLLPLNLINLPILPVNKAGCTIEIRLKITRSSAIAGRPCDAKACQGLLKCTWK